MIKQLSREEAYQELIEEREYEMSIIKKIEECDKDGLSIYLTSDDPTERWLAKKRYQDIGKLEGIENLDNIGDIDITAKFVHDLQNQEQDKNKFVYDLGDI